MTNPWLHIPAPDYEAHMQSAGQSAVLRDFFARTYAEVRPRRLAILGCTTGDDFAHVDPEVTELTVGVDLNTAFLEIARSRFPAGGGRLELVCGDVMEVALPGGPFDLVVAALLLEYVDPACFFRRAAGWLAEGGTCLVVSQEPAPHLPAVTATGYRSLEALKDCMTLRTATEVEALAAGAGLRMVDRAGVTSASGKVLVQSLFTGSHP